MTHSRDGTTARSTEPREDLKSLRQATEKARDPEVVARMDLLLGAWDRYDAIAPRACRCGRLREDCFAEPPTPSSPYPQTPSP